MVYLYRVALIQPENVSSYFMLFPGDYTLETHKNVGKILSLKRSQLPVRFYSFKIY